MMIAFLDFFLGAIHYYVTDPELLPVVDAVSCIICLIFVVGTSCALMVEGFKTVMRVAWGRSD